jgi:hypothetical protein
MFFWKEIFPQMSGGERSMGLYPTEVDILTRRKSLRREDLMIPQKVAGEIAP